MHHIEFFRNGGKTAVNNLLPLCEKHHHLVHEGGCRLTMTSGRIATWRRPDGTIWHTEPTIDRRPSRRTEPAEQQHQSTLCSTGCQHQQPPPGFRALRRSGAPGD